MVASCIPDTFKPLIMSACTVCFWKDLFALLAPLAEIAKINFSQGFRLPVDIDVLTKPLTDKTFDPVYFITLPMELNADHVYGLLTSLNWPYVSRQSLVLSL